ncbi:MAG: ParA family protein [Myxococcales bacterium]|nr:MAG: ParA family protein [Myxococcales bacterium]
MVDQGKSRHFCSTTCRAIATNHVAAPTIKRRSQRIAVFNHKGGTAKTTTAVNLAAGLAERGQNVLLIDADGQGNVGAALGIHGERNLYHCLVQGVSPADVAIPVRKNLDVVTSNEMLAAAELYLANQPNRHRIMRERLSQGVSDYDTIVLDCAPALSLMNQNALMYADSVVVPVSCDYLALVGVKQVLRTIKSVRQAFGHELDLLGVLPTFFDVRNRICRDSVDALTKHFKERCLPPIRVNTRLREAPSVKQTIFEYAPDSSGVTDYLSLVQHIFDLQNPQHVNHHYVAASVATAAMPQVTVTGFLVPTV